MHRAAIKWFLNVLTDLSAEFLQSMCGGTSCNCMSESSKYLLRSSDTSLSMMWSFGVNPASLICHDFLLYCLGYRYLFCS